MLSGGRSRQSTGPAGKSQRWERRREPRRVAPHSTSRSHPAAGGTMKATLEWREPAGLGGFASGTVAGPRTRRYHALLLAATTPPTGRMVLVSGFDAWLERPGLRAETPPAREFLTSQRYAPGVTTGPPADS